MLPLFAIEIAFWLLLTAFDDQYGLVTVVPELHCGDSAVRCVREPTTTLHTFFDRNTHLKDRKPYNDCEWNIEPMPPWTQSDEQAVVSLVAQCQLMSSSISHDALTDAQPISVAGYNRMYELQTLDIMRSLNGVEDVRNLHTVDSGVCLHSTILKLSALRASLTYDHGRKMFAPNGRANSFTVSMQKVCEFSPQMCPVVVRFMTSFRADWSADVRMVLQLMLITLFDPTLDGLQQRNVVATNRQKWLSRLHRHLRHKHSLNKTQATHIVNTVLSNLDEYSRFRVDTLIE